MAASFPLVKVPTPEEKAQRRLAIVLEGYLSGEKWAKERVLRDEVSRWGPNTLEQLLESARFSYLMPINPKKLEQVRKKFLKRRVVLQV